MPVPTAPGGFSTRTETGGPLLWFRVFQSAPTSRMPVGALLLTLVLMVPLSGCSGGGMSLPFQQLEEEKRPTTMVEAPPEIPPCPPPRPALPAEPSFEGDLPVVPTDTSASTETPLGVPEPPSEGQKTAPVSGTPMPQPAPTPVPVKPASPTRPTVLVPAPTPVKMPTAKPVLAPTAPPKTSPVQTVPVAPPKTPPVGISTPSPKAAQAPAEAKKKPIANDNPIEPMLEPIIFDEDEGKQDDTGYVRVETLQTPDKKRRTETRSNP